jgi:hypothetical protein
MNLSAVSTAIADYTFSGFTSNPTAVAVDNDAKTVTFSGGATAADVAHTIEAVPATAGWRIINPANPAVQFVKVQTTSNEGEVAVTIVNPLPDSQLVAYYPFENNFNDATTNLLHGTNSGGVTFTSDTPAALTGSSTAGNFNGSSYVTLPHIGLYNGLAAPGAGGLSISLWIKGASAPANAWFLGEGNTGSSAPAYAFGRVTGTGSPRTYVRNDSNSTLCDTEADTATTPSVISDDTWHHWLWTDDNGTAKVYIDGVSVISDEIDDEWSYTHGTLTLNTTTIGALVRRPADAKYPFLGQIDDVSIWRTTLRSEDIQALAAGVNPESVIGGFDPQYEGTIIVIY